MSTRKSVPPILQQYVRLPPEASLTTVSHILGCSANWLTACFLASALADGDNAPQSEVKDEGVAVVLISWLRDLPFWKQELKRRAGLDLTRLAQNGRFAFVDGLTGLFGGSTKHTASTEGTSIQTLHSSTLAEAEKAIAQSIKVLQPHRILLVLDAPDLLLATASTGSTELSTFIMKQRSLVHSTVLVCAADAPLLSAAHEQHAATPIEAAHAAFVAQQVHASYLTMSDRGLDTGAARDVSGVLRVTRGAEGGAESEGLDGEMPGEAEMLYLVQRDGRVTVFGRGAGDAVGG